MQKYEKLEKIGEGNAEFHRSVVLVSKYNLESK
jgi:hypothetical protein